MNGRTRPAIFLLLALGTTLLLACGSPTPTIEPPTATATVAAAVDSTPLPTTAPVATSATSPESRVDVALAQIQRLDGEILGTVNGQEITWEEYDLMLRQTLYTIERRSPVDWSDPAMKQRLAHLQNEVLRQTAERLLMRQLAADANITVDPEELATRVGEEKQQILSSGAYGSWEDFLRRYGLTDRTFEQVIRDSLILTDFIDIQEVETQSEHVRLAHIAVEDRAVAQEVYDKLAAGADWSEMVAEYSQDTETTDAGGELGWFSRESLLAELAEPAYQLEIGEFSQPIDTQYGYTIIKVLERAMREDDEATIRGRQQAALQALLEAEREKADIEYFVDFEAEAASP
ncbi:MAG: peptidylprolyl isomerase [Anaerolineae bacterium]